MVDQLEDYVIPRLMTLDAPLLAVVGGSTGAGKSTLVNSLVGRRSRAGVLRPDDALAGAGPPPRRRAGGSARPGAARAGAGHRPPDATRAAAVGARDTRSARPGDPRRARHRLGRGANRELAAQLLAAADLWLFVTSAARYADQVPWDFLRRPPTAHAAVAVVLDRTPPEAVDDVAGHLARMLASRGLKDSPLFTVTEGVVDDDGLLPAAVAEIRGWLDRWPPTPRRGRRSSGRPSTGAVRRSPGVRTASPTPPTSRSPPAAAARRRATTAYDEAVRDDRRRRRPTGRCCAARCSPAGRSSSAPASCCARCETRVGRLRDRVVNAVARQAAAGRAGHATRSSRGLETLLLEHAEAAAERAEAPGRGAARPGAARPPAATSAEPRATSAAGPSGRSATGSRTCSTLVRSEGADKRTTARILAYGVNGPRRRADGGGLRLHRRASSGPRSAVAGGTAVARPEAAGGGLRRPGRAHARGARPRRTCGTAGPRLLDAERQPLPTCSTPSRSTPATAERLRAAARRVDDRRFAAAEARSTSPDRARPSRAWRRSSGRGAEGDHDVLARGGQAAGHPGTDIGPASTASTPPRRCPGRLDDALVDDGRPVVERAAGRLRLSADHTVVALAGATGSGKSSTFNALTGLELAAVGVRRPDDLLGHRLRVGGATAPTSCSTGSASPSGTGSRATRCSTRAGEDQRARRRGAARPARPRLDRGLPPPRGRPAGRARRPAGVGARPAEVRRRRHPRPLPRAAGRATAR